MKSLRLVLLFVGLLPALAAAELHRYALFVGADNGGSGRTALRYAVTDALALKGVLTELGGLSNDDATVLGNPDRSAVLKSLAAYAPRIARDKAQGARAEFLFYYSGHSDEDGLLLGNSRLGYGELRDALATVGADVRLAILDSCASGAFTRLKGGTKAAPFLQDESSSLEGHAYLTSSSEDEASQESDKIGGSFFTHYLISGLRGAADTKGDGRVTLNEAYRHAFDETLARTEDTQAGPQHPSYDIQLSGTGDLVLTDLTLKSSRLVLGADLSGQVFVRTTGGNLLAEVRKTAGQPLALAVPAGTYDVSVQAAQGYGQVRRSVTSGQAITVDASDIALGAKQATRARGGLYTGVTTFWSRFQAIFDPADDDRPGKDDTIPFNFGFTPGLEFSWNREATTLVNLYAIVSVSGPVRVVQLAGVGNISQGNTGVQGAGVFNIVHGKVLGAQGAGVFNISDGNEGAQGAGVFNLVHGAVLGAEGAGVFNIADEVRGAQGAGVFNLAGEVRGVQWGGVFNKAGNVRGVQGAGVVNVAGNVSGLQVAGVVNIAHDVSGFQVGVVNIAHHIDGMALGLVNIADNSYGRLGLDYDTNGQTWQTLEWGAGSLHNVLISPPGEGLISVGADGSWGFSWTQPRTWGAGLGLGWGQGLRLETQALAFVDGRQLSWGGVTPAVRAVLTAKMGPLGVHAGWLGTGYFPGYTPDGPLVSGPNTVTTQAFTPGYTWSITGRPFVGASIGY